MKKLLFIAVLFFSLNSDASITNLKVTDVHYAFYKTNVVVISGVVSWQNEPNVFITITYDDKRYTTTAYPVDGKWSILINAWNFIFKVQAWSPTGTFTPEYEIRWN